MKGFKLPDSLLEDVTKILEGRGKKGKAKHQTSEYDDEWGEKDTSKKKAVQRGEKRDVFDEEFEQIDETTNKIVNHLIKRYGDNVRLSHVRSACNDLGGDYNKVAKTVRKRLGVDLLKEDLTEGRGKKGQLKQSSKNKDYDDEWGNDNNSKKWKITRGAGHKKAVWDEEVEINPYVFSEEYGLGEILSFDENVAEIMFDEGIYEVALDDLMEIGVTEITEDMLEEGAGNLKGLNKPIIKGLTHHIGAGENSDVSSDHVKSYSALKGKISNALKAGHGAVILHNGKPVAAVHTDQHSLGFNDRNRYKVYDDKSKSTVSRSYKAGGTTHHKTTNDLINHVNKIHGLKEEFLDEKRGRPRKDSSSDDSDGEANQNIIQQLRKAQVSMQGGSKVYFKDGSSHDVSSNDASKVLDKHASMKPVAKVDFQNRLHKSHQSFKNEVNGVK